MNAISSADYPGPTNSHRTTNDVSATSTGPVKPNIKSTNAVRFAAFTASGGALADHAMVDFTIYGDL